jgi:cell division protease FtsH
MLGQKNNQYDPPSGDEEDRMDRKPGNWRSVLWLFVLIYLLFFFLRGFNSTGDSDTVSYTQFKQAVGQGRVEQVTFKGNVIQGTFRGEGERGTRPIERGNRQDRGSVTPGGDRFTTTKPDIEDPELLPLLESNNVFIRAESTEGSWLSMLVVGLLPWILIVGFFIYASRRMQNRVGGQGGLFGFGKSKAKLFNREDVHVKYQDVAGLENAKKELKEIVDYMKDPRQFRELGATLPKGILLVGPPGVGKTLMAQATAGEANVPFFSASASEFVEMFVGVGASRVRDMFSRAKQSQPSIIFIDELDSVGRVRGTGIGGGHDEREQTLNQILAEMDGFSPRESVIILAATNRPDVLDPALVRPGRFDRQVLLDLPQKRARREILETHVRKVPLAEDVNLMDIAERTVGFSGADLRNIVNEAALLAARKRKDKVGAEDFEQARDKILMGIEREDVITGDEKRMVAFHEAGHALMAKLQTNTDPLQKVSIIARGRALGITEQMAEEDRHNLQKNFLLNRIAIMMGGRVAEKIIFGEISTGGSDDLKKATQIARRMVCEWGMSDNLGPMNFSGSQGSPFLGRELTEHKEYSEHTAQLIDNEVRQILQEKEKDAYRLLTLHKEKLDLVANALLENETLTNDQIDQLFVRHNEN